MLHVTPNTEGFKRLRTLAEALKISDGDFAGPVLRELGMVHRKQIQAGFVSQGATTLGGKWADLNERYRLRKRKAFPGKKILTLSGEMRARFTRPSNPAYVQSFRREGTRAVMSFGAQSSVAAAHVHGSPSFAPGQSSAAARKIFGGTAPRLPVRDMIGKTAAQLAEFNRALGEWYTKRIKQVISKVKYPVTVSNVGGVISISIRGPR